MKPISFKRHRFKPDVIRLAVWLYFRFTASLRDVEDMLAERGHVVSYETVRCWVNKFGPAFAATEDGEGTAINADYGASGNQSRKVADGAPADIVNFSVEPDVTRLVKAGKVDEAKRPRSRAH